MEGNGPDFVWGPTRPRAGSGACGAPKCPERERAVGSSGLHRRLCSGGQGVTSQMIIGGGPWGGGVRRGRSCTPVTISTDKFGGAGFGCCDTNSSWLRHCLCRDVIHTGHFVTDTNDLKQMATQSRPLPFLVFRHDKMFIDHVEKCLKQAVQTNFVFN
jgi:hypothetical protein